MNVKEELKNKKVFTFDDLILLTKVLMGKDGCPWDRVQTHESIKYNCVEEAYELMDAIDLKDNEKIIEETGDVMFQAVFHSVLLEKESEFSMQDILNNLCGKLIGRHSHVFGSDDADNPTEVLSVWEKNKMVEKHQKTFYDSMADVPKTFPSLLRAEKLQKRAGKSGFDFESASDVIVKLKEEIVELENAIENKDENNIKEEVGDLLFSAVNLSRKLGVNSELALKESSDKFLNRFKLLEESISKDGKDITKLSLAELDEYYCKVKENENK